MRNLLYFCLLGFFVTLVFSCAKDDETISSINKEVDIRNGNGNGNNGNTVPICHYDEDTDEYFTIYVNQNAVPAHLNHGDYEGECVDCCVPAEVYPYITFGHWHCELNLSGGYWHGGGTTPSGWFHFYIWGPNSCLAGWCDSNPAGGCYIWGPGVGIVGSCQDVVATVSANPMTLSQAETCLATLGPFRVSEDAPEKLDCNLFDFRDGNQEH